MELIFSGSWQSSQEATQFFHLSLHPPLMAASNGVEDINRGLCVRNGTGKNGRRAVANQEKLTGREGGQHDEDVFPRFFQLTTDFATLQRCKTEGFLLSGATLPASLTCRQ